MTPKPNSSAPRPARRRGGRAEKREKRLAGSGVPASAFVRRQVGFYSLLDEEGLGLIENNADRILAEIGMDFRDDPEVLENFRAAGADVQGERVRFELGFCRSIIQASAPRQFQQHARNPARSVTVGGNNSLFCPSFGRTGDHFWAFEAYDTVPDIVIMAKGIGNGFPLAAVVAKREVAEALADKFYFNTYGANPVACAAGLAVLQVIREEGLQQNAREVGAAKLLSVLQSLHQKHEIIGEVRGRGLMMAIELVTDRKTREPAGAETARIFEATRDKGLILSKSGAYRNVLRMVPPLCIQNDDIDFFAEGLEASFQAL